MLTVKLKDPDEPKQISGNGEVGGEGGVERYTESFCGSNLPFTLLNLSFALIMRHWPHFS